MKELTFQTFIPGCSIQDFYQIAISDETAISKFHREVNRDDSVRVSPWSNGERVVEFILPMAIPKSVQSFIGAGPIRIKERQTVSWKDEATLDIVSEPEVQVSVAKSLVTRAELLITENSEGVSIDVKVVVSASVPWPMTGTVESIMADQAKKTVGQYVEYISGYVEAALEDINNLRRAQEAAAATAVAVATEQQQQQQLQQLLQLQAEGPPTPPEVTAAVVAAAAPTATLAAAAVPAVPVAPAAAAVVTPAALALVPRQVSAVPTATAAAAAAEADLFFDANEAVPGSTLDLLLRELRDAKESREQTNRLLLSIRDAVQHVDYTVTRELAFQEGMRHAQLLGGSSYSWFMSMAATAAAASAATAFLLLRRNALS